MRTPMIAATAAVLLAVAGAGAYILMSPTRDYTSPALLNASGSSIGGPFELTTHQGIRVTDGEVIDGPTLMYFGYTFCPDVCPIDAQVMADAAIQLADQGIDVQTVFVTIDPERDTPEAMSYFVESLHPQMIGLTGTVEEVREAADAYKVFYSRVNAPESAIEYLMNHSAYTYLAVPEDGVIAVFRNGFPPEQIATDVEAVLSDR